MKVQQLQGEFRIKTEVANAWSRKRRRRNIATAKTEALKDTPKQNRCKIILVLEKCKKWNKSVSFSFCGVKLWKVRIVKRWSWLDSNLFFFFLPNPLNYFRLCGFFVFVVVVVFCCLFVVVFFFALWGQKYTFGLLFCCAAFRIGYIDAWGRLSLSLTTATEKQDPVRFHSHLYTLSSRLDCLRIAAWQFGVSGNTRK